MTNFLSLSTLAWSALLGSSHASTAPAFMPISKSDLTLSSKMDEQDPWKFSGYVDLAQETDSASKYFTSGLNRSVFNTHPAGNGSVGVTLANVPKKGLGGTLNVTAGEAANLLTSYGAGSGNYLDITQLFVQYAADKVTLTAGKFATFAGAEVIASPSNYNYSRGILFGYAIPFTHTGLRATFAPASTVSATIGVVNGWDDQRETNTAKTLEAQIAYTPNSTWNLIANGYFGKERLAGLINYGAEGDRSLIDLVGTYNLTSSTSVVLNYDYAEQKGPDGWINGKSKAKWSGIAGYIHHTFSPTWAATLRLEHFEDTDGYRTGLTGLKWDEGTLTFAYTPDTAHEYRLEGRIDGTNNSVIYKKSFDGTTKSVSMLGAQFLWKF